MPTLYCIGFALAKQIIDYFVTRYALNEDCLCHKVPPGIVRTSSVPSQLSVTESSAACGIIKL